MKGKASILLSAALCLGLSGCIVHTHGPGHRSSAVSKKKHKSKRCRPSQYWDGHKCRHKGKGHGARKHDGR